MPTTLAVDRPQPLPASSSAPNSSPGTAQPAAASAANESRPDPAPPADIVDPPGVVVIQQTQGEASQTQGAAGEPAASQAPPAANGTHATTGAAGAAPAAPPEDVLPVDALLAGLVAAVVLFLIARKLRR